MLTLARIAGGPFAAADIGQLEYLAGRAAAGIANALTLRAAREQAALNRAVLDTAADAFVSIDEDSVITAWNPAAERLFGWSAEEAIGRRLRDTIVPERHFDTHDQITVRRRSRSVWAASRIELDAPPPRRPRVPGRGDRLPARAGRPLTFNAFMRDISARRNAERYMRAQLAVTRGAVGGADPRARRARTSSRRSATRSGARSASAGLSTRESGRHPRSHLLDAPRESTRRSSASRRAASFQRGEGLPGRVWATRRAGLDRGPEHGGDFVRAAAADAAGLRRRMSFPVISGDRFIGMIEFFSARAQRRGTPGCSRCCPRSAPRSASSASASASSIEADRLKDEFFALVSHELRTPLTSIIGYLELVLEDAERARPHDRPLPPGRRAQLAPAAPPGRRPAVRRAGRGRQAVARSHRGVDLEPGRRRVRRGGAPARRGERRRPEACAPRRSATAHGDADRLGQMLDNLVSNAIKFTPEGGTVDVCLARRGGHALIEVRDSGVGIPARRAGPAVPALLPLVDRDRAGDPGRRPRACHLARDRGGARRDHRLRERRGARHDLPGRAAACSPDRPIQLETPQEVVL